LPDDQKDTFEHLTTAFLERCEPKELEKYRYAKEPFSQKQEAAETVDSFVTKLRKKAEIAGLDVKAQIFAALNGLRPPADGPNETDSQGGGQSAVRASQRSPETHSVGTGTNVNAQWWPAKHIIRKRLTAGKLEFLVEFRHNTAQWIPDADVSEELKRRYFIKTAAQSRSRQRKYRARFKQGN
jgi:hypothetical protein